MMNLPYWSYSKKASHFLWFLQIVTEERKYQINSRITVVRDCGGLFQ